jgi:hypothetical protein
MAEINVDVSLPDPITANVYVAGPEGPRGPAGESPQINNLNGNYLFLTGQDGIYVFDNGINTIYISGNSGYFESKINKLNNNAIFITGNQIKSGKLIIGDDAGSIVDPNSPYTLSLQTNSPSTWLEILNNSGVNKGVFFGIQDNNFEQYNWQGGDILFFTSQNPSDGIERLRITNNGIVIFKNRPIVNGTGILLSGEIPTLPDTIVYTSGDQNITGIKTFKDGIVIGDSIMPLFLEIKNNTLYVSGGASFVNRPTVNGTGVLLSGEAAKLPNTIVYTTGDQLIQGDKWFENKIRFAPNGELNTSSYISNNGSSNIKIYGDTITLGNNLSSIETDGGDLILNGYAAIPNKLQIGYNAGTYYSEKLAVNGDISANGNIYGNNLVYTSGDQTILGNKIFDGNTYINNLFVTGTQTIVSTNNFSVQSPFLLLNLTGGAVDGGIFFITGSEFTGLNDSGPIIGFDHSDKFKFGVSTRNSDLSTLNDIASVQEIRTYSGVAADKFSTIINLYNTGSDLNIKIDSLSGDLTRNYITISTLNSTGSILDSKINSLSGSAVSIYGNQDINGVKTFINTGSFNALQINHRKFTSYKISANNFEINHDYIYLANSQNDITGTILMGYYLGQEYSEIPSGINYFIKNINNGKLTITGYTMLPDLHPQPNTIDGFDKLILYKNESVQLIGVNNIGYTGWITISADGGIS